MDRSTGSKPTQQSDESIRRRDLSEAAHSTAWIGGAEVAKFVIGLARAKAGAVYLGPAGTGFASLLSSVTNLTHRLVSCGIPSGAVKEIAAGSAEGSRPTAHVTRSVQRRLTVVTTLLGTLILVLFAPSISLASFGTDEYASSIRWLSAVLILRGFTNCEQAVLQGTRRIESLARITVINAVLGVFIAVGVYHVAGIKGVIPVMILVAGIEYILSLWAVNRLRFEAGERTPTWSIAKSILATGLVVSLPALSFPITAWVTRGVVSQDLGLDAVGLYQSGFRIAALGVNFVIAALAVDCLPRFAAVAEDRARLAQQCSDQIMLGLTLFLPVLVLVMTCAPLAIRVIYTADYLPAAELIRWFLVGGVLRIAYFPVGIAHVAVGAKRRYTTIESVSLGVTLGLTVLFIRLGGLQGAAWAYALSGAFQFTMLQGSATLFYGIKWHRSSRYALFGALTLAVVLVLASSLLSSTALAIAGVPIVAASGVLSLRLCVQMAGPETKLSRLLRRVPGLRS